jgi:hypothetical protein
VGAGGVHGSYRRGLDEGPLGLPTDHRPESGIRHGGGSRSEAGLLYVPYRGRKGPLAGGDAGQGPLHAMSLRQPSDSEEGM